MPVDETERERRRQLVQAHMDAENAHDLEAIIATFADDGEMIFNESPFQTKEAISAAHAGLGMSSAPGALDGLRVVPVADHITDDEIVIEGFVEGTHALPFAGFDASQKFVRLRYVAVYRFDDSGKLASERVVMNFEPMGKPE